MKKMINGHAVEVVKVGAQERDRRRSTRSSGDRYVTSYTWNAIVDGVVIMDGCATRTEALGYAERACA